MKFQQLIPALLLVAFVGSQGVNAAQIDYASVETASLMFTNISEDTTTDGALFGQPVGGGGDRVDFNPVEFEASTDGGSEIVDSQLSFTVMAKEGSSIGTITFTESGDYTLAGLGAALADAAVSANIFWEVTELDGNVVAPISGSASMPFVASGGSYELGVDPNSDSFDGFISLDVAGFVASEGFSGSPTKAQFTLDNTLLVSASNGGSAFIKKKDFDGLVINIPEPSTHLLLVFGALAGLCLSRRRRA